MFTKTMTFDDLDGNKVTQTFYFHYSMLEIAKMLEFDQLEEKVNKLTTSREESGLSNVENNRQAYAIFEELVLNAYGQKGEDNVSFVKTPELKEYWRGHVALPEMIFEFLGDEKKAAEFVERCLPAAAVAKAKAEVDNKTEPSEPAIAPSEQLTDGKTDNELLEARPSDLTRDQLVRVMQLRSNS